MPCKSFHFAGLLPALLLRGCPCQKITALHIRRAAVFPTRTLTSTETAGLRFRIFYRMEKNPWVIDISCDTTSFSVQIHFGENGGGDVLLFHFFGRRRDARSPVNQSQIRDDLRATFPSTTILSFVEVHHHHSCQ